MRKGSPRESNGIRREYDFGSMKGGVRGKYVRAFRSGTNLVLLDADVAEAFPTSEAVNETLRAALSVASAIRESGNLPDRRSKRATRARRTPPKRASGGARRR